MQNSYGRVEHSNFKGSPIFPQKDTQKGDQRQISEEMKNFPLNSMLVNKAGKIKSNFDPDANLQDAMTPFYSRPRLSASVNEFAQGQKGGGVAEATKKDQIRPAGKKKLILLIFSRFQRRSNRGERYGTSSNWRSRANK
jgi:hypothetical protein